MAQRRRRAKRRTSLPYKKIYFYYSSRSGRAVTKYFRGRKFRRLRYFSLITFRFVSVRDISKDRRVQALRELFPGRSSATRRKISKTLREYKLLEMNAIEESPSLKRYFSWVKDHYPKLYPIVSKQLGLI